MKKFSKTFIALSAILMPIFSSNFIEAKEYLDTPVILKSEGYATSSDSYVLSKIIVYKNKNDIPNSIWCETNGYKGYIYIYI